MPFVLDDLAIAALVATATGTVLQAKAQSDFQRKRRRKIEEGLRKLDADTRKSEKLVREQGLNKLEPNKIAELRRKNDQINAATLAKVSSQISPARQSATSGFKGKVSGRFANDKIASNIASARRFKKSAIQTGRFLSVPQTTVDRGNILTNLGIQTAAQRGFTLGNQRVNQIQLDALQPSKTLLGLSQLFKIGGAVAGAGSAFGAGGGNGFATGFKNLVKGPRVVNTQGLLAGL